MIIIKESTFEKARKKINENPNEKIIFTSNDDELNRKILEKMNIDFLLINQNQRKDFQKQRNSGFNSVLAKIAKKNNIGIGINLNEIIESSGSEKARILARVEQNIKLCNKQKINMIIVGKQKRNIYDLRSLGLVLGMPTWMTKGLQTFFN